MRPQRITIGKSQSRKVWLDPARRSYHLHVVGGTGRGKSKLLESMIREDILKGHGLCLVDPHGAIYEQIVQWCARNRIDEFRKIHLIDPLVGEWCVGFNPLKHYPWEEPLHRVDNAIEALSQVWGGEKSTDTPSIRTVLRSVLTALVEHGQTFNESFPLTRLYDDDSFRQFLTQRIENPTIREQWAQYELIAKKAPREFVQEFGGARRRLLELLHDERIRSMLGQIEHAIDFRRCMDESHIVLVNFSDRAFGEDRARALGAMLIREMFLVAKNRDLKVASDRPFYLYIDECAKFLTSDISDLLAQTRKYGLHAILAHQWLQQLRDASPKIYAAVMGIQNKVVFGGLADEDAALLADELFRSEYDIEMPVEALIKPTVVRYVQTWLHHWAHSETEGTVESGGETESYSMPIASDTTFDDDGFPLFGISGTNATGASQSEQSSTSEVSMTTSASGASEAFLPELEDRPTSVHSMETLRHLAMKRLRELPKQHAVVKAAELPSFDMKVYDVTDPTVGEYTHRSFIDRVMKASPFALSSEKARAVIEDRSRRVSQQIEAWRFEPTPAEEPEEYLG